MLRKKSQSKSDKAVTVAEQIAKVDVQQVEKNSKNIKNNLPKLKVNVFAAKGRLGNRNPESKVSEKSKEKEALAASKAAPEQEEPSESKASEKSKEKENLAVSEIVKVEEGQVESKASEKLKKDSKGKPKALTIPQDNGLNYVMESGLLSIEYEPLYSAIEKVPALEKIRKEISELKFADIPELKFVNVSENKKFIIDPKDPSGLIKKVGQELIRGLFVAGVKPSKLIITGRCIPLMNVSNRTILVSLSGEALGSHLDNRDKAVTTLYTQLQQSCDRANQLFQGAPNVILMQQISEDFKQLINKIAVRFFPEKKFDLERNCAEHSFIAHLSKMCFFATKNGELKDIQVNSVFNIGLTAMEVTTYRYDDELLKLFENNDSLSVNLKGINVDFDDKDKFNDKDRSIVGKDMSLMLPFWVACDNCQKLKEIYLFTLAVMQLIPGHLEEEEEQPSPIDVDPLVRDATTALNALQALLAKATDPIGKYIFEKAQEAVRKIKADPNDKDIALLGFYKGLELNGQKYPARQYFLKVFGAQKTHVIWKKFQMIADEIEATRDKSFSRNERLGIYAKEVRGGMTKKAEEVLKAGKKAMLEEDHKKVLAPGIKVGA